MKVSVIIPAYNEQEYIEKAIKSVINQNESPNEIIVINNNSVDKTVDIAKKLGVRIINEKMQGMIPARNRGFNEAKSDIIARIDADVIVPKDWIKRIKKNFDKKNIDALSGPVSYYDSRIVPSSPTPSKLWIKSLSMFSGGKKYLIGPNMALTHDIWNKVKNHLTMNDKKVHEDLDLSLGIHRANGIIGFDPNLVVKFSARRVIKNPTSFFVEYPIRTFKTFMYNNFGFKTNNYKDGTNSRNKI